MKRPTFPIDASLIARQQAAREKLVREGKQIDARHAQRRAEILAEVIAREKARDRGELADMSKPSTLDLLIERANG